MTIVSNNEILNYVGVSAGYFSIDASNNTMNFTSDQGGPSDITLSDGTYSGSTLATEVQTQLNANDTLTGTGTITFSVSYDSDGYTFTIDAGSGHTIAYDYSESNAGYTLGFDEDESAAQTITSNSPAGDPTGIITGFRDAVESYIQNRYCFRTFDSTSYTIQRYDGSGGQILNLNDYPITAVDRVAIGTRDVIMMKNTSTNSTASVSVTSTGLRLVKDGTADVTVLFADYTTISTVITAINAIGSGWSAQVISSEYNSFKSTELIELWARSAIDSNWVYLTIPEEAEYDIEVYSDRGQLFRRTGFPKGHRNIFVDFTAGYSSSNMPEDLKLAIKILVKLIYQKRDEETFGLSNYRIGDQSVGFENIAFGSVLPKEVKDILDRYKRRPRLW